MQKTKMLLVMMLALSFSIVGNLSYANCNSCKNGHRVHGKNYTCHCKKAGKKCACVHKMHKNSMHSEKTDRQAPEVTGEQADV